jgi:hypothetical protein
LGDRDDVILRSRFIPPHEIRLAGDAAIFVAGNIRDN